jgi:hypothetical protein
MSSTFRRLIALMVAAPLAVAIPAVTKAAAPTAGHGIAFAHGTWIGGDLRFSSQDPGGDFAVRKGGVGLTPARGEAERSFYTGRKFGVGGRDRNGSGTYRVSLSTVPGFVSNSRTNSDWAGLVFWAADFRGRDYYCLTVTPDGRFAVRRHAAPAPSRTTALIWLYTPIGQFTDIVPATPAKAWKPGQWNRLKLVLDGSRGTIFVNGVKVGGFTGTPPASGWFLGIVAGAESNTGTAWRFLDGAADPGATVAGN